MIFRLFETSLERDLRETRELIISTEKLHQQVLGEGTGWAEHLIGKVVPAKLSEGLADKLSDCLWKLLEADGILLPFDTESELRELTLEDRMALRERCRRKQRVLSRATDALPMVELFFRFIARELFEGLKEESGMAVVEVPVAFFHRDFPDFLEQTLKSLASDEMQRLELFVPLSKPIRTKALYDRSFRWPKESKETDPYLLVDEYMKGSPLGSLCLAEVSYSPPLSSRLEHTQIVGGSGHGKTELLKSC